MILILDYGMGNLRSVQKAFEQAENAVRISSDYHQISKADKIVLPGVGAFGDAMKNIEKMGFREPMLQFIATGRPFLGICLGMQLLFSDSTEKGTHAGLSVIPGRVVKFPAGEKVPQIGWNQVRIRNEKPLFEGIPDDTYFYFVHSYYVVPETEAAVAGTTDYGIPYASAVAAGNVFGVQFHPEKSQNPGLRLIRNFCRA
jgi:glutamine amidotransferase